MKDPMNVARGRVGFLTHVGTPEELEAARADLDALKLESAIERLEHRLTDEHRAHLADRILRGAADA